MRIQKAVLFSPFGIARWRASIELGVGVAKHKTYLDVWMLFFDEQVFLPIINSPATLSFDKEKAALFWQLKIRCVFGCSARPDVLDFVCLVANW